MPVQVCDALNDFFWKVALHTRQQIIPQEETAKRMLDSAAHFHEIFQNILSWHLKKGRHEHAQWLRPIKAVSTH